VTVLTPRSPIPVGGSLAIAGDDFDYAVCGVLRGRASTIRLEGTPIRPSHLPELIGDRSRKVKRRPSNVHDMPCRGWSDQDVIACRLSHTSRRADISAKAKQVAPAGGTCHGKGAPLHTFKHTGPSRLRLEADAGQRLCTAAARRQNPSPVQLAARHRAR